MLMSEERRQNWPTSVDTEFWQRLNNHMLKEELREKMDANRLDAIESDLQPLKKMYWAVIGSGGVLGFLLMTLLFIYNADRETIKGMQEILYKQGTAIEKLIQSHGELEKDYRRDIERIERSKH
jgi:hypothetical protein